MDVQIKWGMRVPLRDGVHLSATLYLPKGVAPSPGICALTPYIAQSHHAQAVYFATRGLPFVVVDVRGRGNSDGEFHPRGEAADAFDVVEWIARQPFCNGKVGMWGGSYLGYCQWAAAREKPPHLATIVPTAAPFRGVDSPLRNNVFTPYTVQWLTILAGRTLQDRMFSDRAFWNRRFQAWFESGTPFKHLDEFLDQPSALFQEWVSHPHRDAYWDSYNPSPRQYAEMSLPILTITGAYDADQLGALAHYKEHLANASPAQRQQHYLVIGPWDHGGANFPKAEFGGIKVGAASVIDLQQLHAQWYAWTLADGPKPEFLQRQVAYYVIGDERWHYADRLEDVTARYESFHLASTRNPDDVYHAGMLGAPGVGRAEPDHYVYDPRDVSRAELESSVDCESLVDQRMLHASVGKRLVYHSAPFESDTTIAGFFRLSLWLGIDTPDTDFHVGVYDIGIDGSAVLLASDWMRARYRESFRTPKLIDTQTPLRYEFNNFMFVARRIPKGNRLRLVVGPIDSIYFEKNYNSGGDVAAESKEDARVATVRLYHDEAHPSALYVPIGA